MGTAAGGANFGGGGTASLGIAGTGAVEGTLKVGGSLPDIPPEMIRVYSLGPACSGGGIDIGSPPAEERTWVAPAGCGGPAIVGLGTGSIEGFGGSGAGGVHAGSLDDGASLFGAVNSKVCMGALVRGGAAG